MIFAPTSVGLVVGLYYLNIPYNKWFKFIWKFLIALFILITITSITIGTIGTLLFGVGMCCVLVWTNSIEFFVTGTVIGIIGMIIAGLAYPIYKKVTKKERAKIAEQIISLSDELSLR